MGVTSGLWAEEESQLSANTSSGWPWPPDAPTHGAVVVLWTDVTVLLPPVDLEQAAATDLTHLLVGGFVHTCSETRQHVSTFSCSVPERRRVYLVGTDCSSERPPAETPTPRDTWGTGCSQRSCGTQRSQMFSELPPLTSRQELGMTPHISLF